MSIRDDIIDAYVSTLEGITIANGYNTDVVTVDAEARGWDEAKTIPGLRCWIGVVPQREDFTDTLSYVDSLWTIELLAYQTVSARTAAGIQTANSHIMADIRKALYADPQLGVNGVVEVSLVSSENSTGSPESADDGIAAISVPTTVLFQELLGA